MVGDELSELIHAFSRQLLDPGSHLGVRLRAARLGQRGICDIANQGVLERILGLAGEAGGGPRADEPAPLERKERRRDNVAQAAAQWFGPEHLADDRGLLEDALLSFRDGVDAGRQQRQERVGQRRRRDAGRAPPPIPFADQGTFFDEAANYLLEEEGVAFRLGKDLGRHCSRQVGHAQQRAEQLLAVCLR